MAKSRAAYWRKRKRTERAAARVLTVAEVADAIGKSRWTVTRLLRLAKPGYPRHRWRIPVSELPRILALVAR